MRDRLPHIESSLVKVGNAHVDQVKIVQVCVEDIEGCQFGCQQSSGNAPVDLAREECLFLELADGRSLLAAWFGLKDCSGPRA